MHDFMKAYGPVIFLGVPGLFYLGQAAWYGYMQGKIGLPIAFIAYAVANVGYILDSRGY